MMLDSPNPQQPPAAASANGPLIFDVGTAEFEQAVMAASVSAPIIVDFWAPWCGPCKQMMPALEQAVQAAGGKIRLAKVNIDEHPELAQALRIQSVPTVFGFFGGQPVDAFMGAKSPAEIKAFIDKLIDLARQAQPDALDIPAALEGAAQALAAGEIGAAQAIYSQILAQDPQNAPAYAGIVRSFIALGDLAEAGVLLDEAPPAIATHAELQGAAAALEIAQNAPDQGALAALAAQLEQNPADHQARFELAQAYFAAGRKEEAVDALVEIIRRERSWQDDKARQELLKLFEAMGSADPVTLEGRRKLSTVLFS